MANRHDDAECLMLVLTPSSSGFGFRSIKTEFKFRKETGTSVLSDIGIYPLKFHQSSCLKSAVCIDGAVLREREPSFSDQHEKQTAEVVFYD